MTVELTRNDVVIRAKALKAVPGWVPTLEIGSHWLQIIAAIAVFYFFQSWWLLVPVLLIVSTRQYGLAILLHDAQHNLLYPDKKINAWLATWLIAAPQGVEFISSQSFHLDHHFNFGDPDEDPDYALYCYGPPSPKQTSWQVAALVIFKLVGGKITEVMRKNYDFVRSADRTGRMPFWVRWLKLVARLWRVIAVHLTLLAVLTYMFGWWGYPLLWALPLVTLAAFYNDIRIFLEHSIIGRDAAHKDERLASFLSNPLERFFVSPNHMNYHAEHHMFPYVPHRNLPALRLAVQSCPELNSRVEWRSSYLAHFTAYVRNLHKGAIETGSLVAGKTSPQARRI